jgi:hypothetical protein
MEKRRTERENPPSKTAKKFKHGEPRDKESGPSRAKIDPQTANFGVN